MAKAPVSDAAVYTDFKDAFPELSGNPNAPVARGSDAKRDRTYKEVVRRTIKQGWNNCTIVNLHTFPLDLQLGGGLGHISVSPRKAGEAFMLKVVNQPRFAPKDLGDANFEFIPVFPKEIAEDLVREYRETGGVFCYEGDGPVPEDLLDAAMEGQLKWYWELFQEGNSNWAAFAKNPRYITDRMRDAAKELFIRKLINTQPEWITITRNESPDTPCEGCGTVIPKVARFCPNCHTIFDANWVRARRPDIWLAQNPEPLVSQVIHQHGNAQGSQAPDIAQFIKDEEDGKSPLSGNNENGKNKDKGPKAK